MSYQDRIYRQSGICAQKNSTVNVARTSSDLKIYEIPMYTMTTADKIVQNTLYFDLSGISYNDIFTATTNCFTTNLLSGSCFNSISWYTNIYANNELVSTDLVIKFTEGIFNPETNKFDKGQEYKVSVANNNLEGLKEIIGIK